MPPRLGSGLRRAGRTLRGRGFCVWEGEAFFKGEGGGAHEMTAPMPPSLPTDLIKILDTG